MRGAQIDPGWFDDSSMPLEQELKARLTVACQTQLTPQERLLALQMLGLSLDKTVDDVEEL